MGSFISWLDHSEEDQRRVREMLQLFSDKDTVDDLGFGTVRDAISNALFPGTSVIQTRARYFLFIPWIFRRAERRHPHQLVAKATDMERTLIGALKDGGDHAGLIGVDAGRNVRTLPSAIFWGGLIRYGIFLAPSLSIRQYGRHVARGLVAADAEDEIGDRAPSFWEREIPDAPPGFFNFKSENFDLTRSESEWLCERIISSDRFAHHESLLTAYIKDLRRGRPLGGVDAVWDATLPTDIAEAIARLVHHAEHFSCAAHGAALLYNLELAEQRKRAGPEETDATSKDNYRTRLDEWRAHARRVRLATWAENIDDFWDCILDQGARIPPRTRRFVDEWAGFLASDTANIASSVTARTLVRDRELEHKRGQARLANRKRLDDWAGNAGTAPLAFRWPQVQRMLTDIADGLNATESDDQNAVA
jgi:hypothetical protein